MKSDLLNGYISFFSPACEIEVPERLSVSHEALVRNGLADRCISIPVREATDADILLVHRSVIEVYFFYCVYYNEIISEDILPTLSVASLPTVRNTWRQ